MPASYGVKELKKFIPGTFLNLYLNCTLIVWYIVGVPTGCPKIKVSLKQFNSDQLVALIDSFLILLDSVDLQVLFFISFVILTCLNEI